MQIYTHEIKREYAIIDAETTNIEDGERPKTKFWGYADSDRYERFATTRKLLNFLTGIPPKTVLHHTNFDVIQLLLDGTNLSILKSHNGKLIKCKLQEHYLLNSYAVFPEKMAKIFAAFGFTKTSLKNLDKRNYEDCVNGLNCFLQLDAIFQKLVSVSPLSKGTIAATGFSAAEKFAGRMPPDLRFLESYRGGRVEVYDTRKMECGKYDIHSSYPASFLDAPAETELWEVQVKTRDWHGPLFHSGFADMLLFPNGSFPSYVYRDVWEKYIEPYAEKTSIKILSRHRINLAWLCELKPLIKTMYDKKQSSDGGIQYCCKLLLNSLYGRIGLKGESERARILDYIPDGDDISIYFLGKNRFLCFDKISRESRSNFPFASYITDNARGRLFKAFKRNHPLYGDTDSVFTPVAKGNFSESIGDACGEWGFEGREMFRATNVKDYVFGGKEVRKGGTRKTIWTMKRFAANLNATEVIRERKQGLRKRLVNGDGTTEPITVKH